MVFSIVSILLITVFAFRDVGGNCINKALFEGFTRRTANPPSRPNASPSSHSRAQSQSLSLLLPPLVLAGTWMQN